MECCGGSDATNGHRKGANADGDSLEYSESSVNSEELHPAEKHRIRERELYASQTISSQTSGPIVTV